MRAALGGLMAAALLAVPLAAPAQPPVREQDVKAAFLFRFLPFVEWPQDAFAAPAAPIVIGVLGNDEVAAELEAIVAGRVAQGRPVRVKRLRAGEPLAGLHMVFVGRGQEERLPEVARALRAEPVLLVAESEGALDEGAMVNFLVAGGRVRFEVALDAAERARLRISSRMLAVAMSVRPRP